jgi:hypothetical protein
MDKNKNKFNIPHFLVLKVRKSSRSSVDVKQMESFDTIPDAHTNLRDKTISSKQSTAAF